MGIANLSYIRLQVNDPASWAEFAETVLGFGDAHIDDGKGGKYLRMDMMPFRYIIEQADEEKFVAAGYELANEADFTALKEKLRAAGVEVQDGTDEQAARRATAGFASCLDPSGNVVEFCYGREVGDAFTPNAGISAFKTGAMGLGHLVLPAPENDATIKFYTEIFGFGCCDDLTLPPPAPGLPDQRIYFMHADNPRHHTLGLYNFPHPVGLIHVMVEVSSIDEVGACMDRVKEAGLHIFASLGRHANDEMVSFYFFAPGGFGVEVGFDGKQVEDWDAFTPTKSTIGDIWGHEYDVPVMEG